MAHHLLHHHLAYKHFDESAIILKRNLVDGKDNQITEKLPKNNKFRKIDLDSRALSEFYLKYKSSLNAHFKLKEQACSC